MQQRGGHLSKGVVHLIAHSRLIVAGQAPMANMANYAHYQNGAGTHGGNPDALADCVLRAEGMLGEIFVNHDHRFATDTIVFIEEATLAQRNAHHFQVVWRYAGRQRDGLVVRWRGRGGGPVREGVLSFAHGDNIGQRDRVNARDAPSTIEYVLPGLADLLGIPKRTGRKREARGDYVVHVETGIEG